MSKRLLFVVNDAGFFISHRLPIALAMRDRGYCVAIACPADRKTTLFASNDLLHLDVPLARGRIGPFGELRALRELNRQIREFDPDLVHLITSKPVIYGGILTRWRKIPAVAAISGLGHVFIDNSLRSRMLRAIALIGYRIALNRRGMFVIFQNLDNLRLFQQHKALREEPALIRGSGTQISKFDSAPAANSIPRVVLPARMLFSKGVAEFVEAARMLRARNIAAEFVLVGDPDLSNPATVPAAQLRAWDEEGVIRWEPHRPDIETVLKYSDLVVLPSYNEGFPKTLVDAAAAGRAVVTSDVTGCRDAIIPGETGLLAPPQNSAELAERIADLLTDPDRRLAMGQAGRALAEADFAIEQIVAQHLALYDRALSSQSEG